MNPWLRRSYIILTLGGSFAGAVLTLQLFFTAKDANPLLYALLAGVVGLYVYGIWAGLLFSEKEDAKKHLVIFHWLQVPWLSSPIIGYRFTSGFHISGAIIGDKLNGFFRLGSDWQINLFQGIPWGIGLNFFALAMVLILLKQKAPIQSSRLPLSGPGLSEMIGRG